MSEVRLIDADELKKGLQERHDFYVQSWGGFSNMPFSEKSRMDELNACIAEIVNAPTVELFCSYLSDGEVRQPCVEAPCKHERLQGEWKCLECFKRAKETRTLLFCEAVGKCKFEKGGAE